MGVIIGTSSERRRIGFEGSAPVPHSSRTARPRRGATVAGSVRRPHPAASMATKSPSSSNNRLIQWLAGSPCWSSWPISSPRSGPARLPVRGQPLRAAFLQPGAGPQHRRRVQLPGGRVGLAALVLRRTRRRGDDLHHLDAAPPRAPDAVRVGAQPDPGRRGGQHRRPAAARLCRRLHRSCTGPAGTTRRSTSPTAPSRSAPSC